MDELAPIFIVGAPHCGDGALLLSLAHASRVHLARSQAATFLDELPEVDPSQRGWESHRLVAEDAPGLTEKARRQLLATLHDREGRPAEDHAPEDMIALAGGARLALRVPFLAAVWPRSRFVLLTRDPAEAVPEMLASWESGQLISAPGLPGWDGPPWSLPLIPGWQSLSAEPLQDIVVEQWRSISEILLADLEQLGPERWCVADHAGLLEQPRSELLRLCHFLGVPYDQSLLSPVEQAARLRSSQAASALAPELAAALPRTGPAAARLRALLAPVDAPSTPRERSPFHSVSTASFAQHLRSSGASLLISTYQSGKLIIAREQERLLNTHFRDFDKPMGMAVAPGRFALGTRSEIWDFRDMPETAPKLEPAGTHDACYLPRNRHTTGDIAIHEMFFAGGELWVVATEFSCLATIDSDHSFVPRWRPPFITALAVGDRCHLNGLAIVDEQPRYVTALGESDETGGWRPGRASGGLLMDVSSSEVVLRGLSMPHSPRWHDGRLWLLESGRGALCLVDPASGQVETVAELPGFTRGLAFSGHTAFVGLSQIRESSTFGDLPLTERLTERQCGVWMVDLRSGEISGFLRFEDLVQEVFDVALLPGVRFPEVAEPGSSAATTSYVLP